MKKIIDKKFTLKDGTDIFLEINIDKRNNNGYAAVTVPGCDGVQECYQIPFSMSEKENAARNAANIPNG